MNTLHAGFSRVDVPPMLECYEEGGYEAGSSNFKAGVAELIIAAGLSLLEDLKK